MKSGKSLNQGDTSSTNNQTTSTNSDNDGTPQIITSSNSITVSSQTSNSGPSTSTCNTTTTTSSTSTSSIVLKSCPPYLTRTPSESHSISLSNQHLLYYLHHKKNSRKKRISAPVFRTVNTPTTSPANPANINSRNMIILRSRKSWPVEELRVKR